MKFKIDKRDFDFLVTTIELSQRLKYSNEKEAVFEGARLVFENDENEYSTIVLDSGTIIERGE